MKAAGINSRRAGILAGVAACIWATASGGAAKPSTHDQQTWSGRLLFMYDDTRLVIREGGVDSDDRDSCVDVRPKNDTLREQMERMQNARVQIHNAGAGDGDHCRRSISVSSVKDVEILSAPEPFKPADLAGYVPEERIAHAEDMRHFAIEAMQAISKVDYLGFRRMELLDPEVESLLERSHNDFAKRRFTFIAQHAKEFFGDALHATKPRVIVRQFEGRSGGTVCICRRATPCAESEGFDAPRLGSWGDSTFCFRLYYDGDEEVDGYRYQQWRVADPIFGAAY